jgi:hypothetical protein
MLFKGEFYREADELNAELQALRQRHPSLMLYKWKDGRIRVVNMWYIGRSFAEAARQAATEFRILSYQIEYTKMMIARFGEAIDQSNRDDSGTPGIPTYSGLPAFLRRIYRKALARLWAARGQGPDRSP